MAAGQQAASMSSSAPPPPPPAPASGMNAQQAAKAAREAAAAEASRDFSAAIARSAPYHAKRVQLFEALQQAQQQQLEAARAAATPITITMPDGAQRTAIKFVTTPFDLAKDISANLAKKTVVAEVDLDEWEEPRPWDLMRPLEFDCKLRLFGFDDPKGKDVSAPGALAPCCLFTGAPVQLILGTAGAGAGAC